ncbi:MAG: amino acid ABC transporter permease [Catenulispora sp. 13_1_20CM_3_70_7]|nr:MAG: amino acid ABC transporter permease [Catenulispora sp. 13_1_20CM_3_70_7]
MNDTGFLYDAPGPRARRRILAASVLTGLALAAVAVWIVVRLNDRGQFVTDLWEPFNDPSVWSTIGQGLGNTLKAAALAIVFAIAFGAVLAAGRLSDHAPVRWVANLVVEVFRAIPLLIMMIALFAAFPATLGPLWSVVIALTVYNGSLLSEVFRAGVNGVPSGQREAAFALGLRKTQVLTLVLLPQAVRTMLPVIISQCVVTLKDTALGRIVTYQELLLVGSTIEVTYQNYVPTTIVLAAIYVSLNMSVSGLAQLAQRWLSRARKSAPPASITVAEPGA